MISRIEGAVRRKWAAYSETPFPRLVRLFAGRIFHGSGDGQLDMSMGLLLSLLALPGGFYAILLLEKYATLLQWMRGQRNPDPLAGVLPDEYFFIVLSMVVTGVVAVWRWESIFPDRRDYANLVPLPVSTRSIFLANMAAIALLALVLALVVNAASAVLFPVAVCASEHKFGFFAQFLGVHAAVVLLASIFSFFAVFVVVGLLMVVFPYAMFRRISLYLRGLLVAGWVALLSTSFVVPPAVTQVPGTLVRFLPPVWFLGLCQMLRGRATLPLAALGRVALLGSGVVVVAAVAIYSLSYRRCFGRIPETTDTGSSSIRTRFSWIFPQLDRTILSSPFQRAGYRFVIKTLFRSEQHGLVLGGFFGLGIVIASQFLFAAFNSPGNESGGLPSSEILAIPLILSYCAILGVRFAFEIPIELRANWIFRLSHDKATQECIPLARKAILSFVLPWMFAIGLPVYWAFWGWRVGLLQTTVVTVWSLLLTEVLLARFRKIPFSCSYPPFRHSAVVSVMSYVVGFFLFVVVTSELEYRALLEPAWMALFPAIALSVWYGLSRFHERIEEIDKELIFEDNAPPAFVTLDLGHRS